MLHIKSIRYYWIEQPAFILFCFALLIFLTRIFLRSSLLEIDEAEQFVMAQHLLPGYPDQPPLYSWVQYLVFKLFGRHLISLAILKSLLLFTCFYSFHRLCRLYCQSVALAWCATLGWVFIPVISFDLMKDNTHSILALLAACLTWYWFIAPTRLSKIRWYALFGCIIGVGLLSKFNYLIFLLSLGLSAVSLAEYRRKLVNYHCIITLLVAAAITSPYYFWLIHHPNLAFRSAYKLNLDSQPLQGLQHLVKATLIFISPGVIIARLFFPLTSLAKKKPFRLQNHLLIRYHLVCFSLLVGVIFLTNMSNFQTRWLIPLFFLCPLLYFSRVNAQSNVKNLMKYYLIMAFIIQLTFFTFLIYRSHSEQKHQDQLLISQLLQAINKEQQPTEFIVTDSLWLLGNFMLLLPDNDGWLLHPAIHLSLPRGHSLLIWQASTTPGWVDNFAKLQPKGSKINFIENPSHHRIIAGYTYANVKF